MRRSLSRLLAAVTAVLLTVPLLAGLASTAYAHTGDTPAFRVLVFSKTTGFRHDSIPDGIAAIQKLGADNNFAVDATEDATLFTETNLAKYQTVVFLSTTGDPLDQESEKAAFQKYIEQGGGFVGIHAAADSGYNWAWYGNLVGAYFKDHPAQQQATLNVEDPAHPSTEELPSRWSRTDEWYNYQTNPRGKVHVLTSLDEKSYSGGGMGADHPNTWCQNYDGGKSWYTGLGHTKESYTDPNFLHLLLGGLRTTAGAVQADCSASLTSSFQKVPLDTDTNDPMMLEVAKDGRVFFASLGGDVKAILPGSNQVVNSGHLNVLTANESGMLGLTLDPGFATNHWLYVFYSPTGESVDQISRFTVNSDSTLDKASEKVVLKVPVQRDTCCHHGGAMLFDKDGNLWLSTGDNTNPFGSPTNSRAPLDYRPGQSASDAARSSGNTNSLSGKVLRIHPEADGTYTVPSGNLFPPGTAETKPEIYAMGFRNPFRIGTDPETGRVLVADYGPDAGSDDPKRGPRNAVEWNILQKPGNYGWPFCLANNQPYIHYDYATGVSGEPYDCANGPVNDSPNNTGLKQLPKPIPATVWYHYDGSAEFPPLSGGAPMAGPIYRYDAALNSDNKWPEYYDGKAIFAEWNTSQMYTFQLDDNQSAVNKVNPFLKGMGFAKPMDMKFGPDGALYMIEWGSSFGGNNADSGIYRIDYVNGRRSPVPKLTATPTNGSAPLTVKFSSNGSSDPNGGSLTYAWDYDADGTVDSTEPNPIYTYTTAGNFTASLTVTNTAGKSASLTQQITVGNTQPTVTLDGPAEGGAFDWGDKVDFSTTVTDPEDGSTNPGGGIDCSQVTVTASLGHATHAHAMEQFHACQGTSQTAMSPGHGGAENIFWVLDSTYRDKGGAGGSSPLTGKKTIVLHPKKMQAEFYTAASSSIKSAATTDPTHGEVDVAGINDGSYTAYSDVNFSRIDSLTFRVANLAGGTIEAHADSVTGPLIATAAVPAGKGEYSYITAPVKDPGGVHTLYLVFKGASAGAQNLFRLNWMHLDGRGATAGNAQPFVMVDGQPLTGDLPLAVKFTARGIDPQGSALTYKWDFGDGTTSTEQNPTHTYTKAGPFTAKVTATNALGVSSIEEETISGTATLPTISCLGKLSDEFNGTSLDETRWSVVRQNQDLAVKDGSLVIPTSDTDIYGAGGDTPNIVLQPAPSGAWQATTKLTLPAVQSYQQAGLVLYGDDNNYAKMMFEGRSGSPDAAQNVFQFARENNGSPSETNSAAVGPNFPSTVYLRLTSDGTNITGSYSSDGATFKDIPGAKPISGITNPRIGLMSLAGKGTTPVIDAAFDWFHLTPDASAPQATPGDEFDGSALDGCRWNSVVRPDLTALGMSDGQLQITTSKGDIFSTPNTDPKNLILQKAPAGDWTIETKIDGTAFNQGYQQGGVMVRVDDDNYVKLDYIADSATSRRIEFRSESGGKVDATAPDVRNLTNGVWYLRIAKQGSAYHGFYSSDGKSWTEMSAPLTNTALDTGSALGVFAIGVNQQTPATAKFDYFHLDGATGTEDKTPPVTKATLTPGTPDGKAGWYVSPASVSLAATDATGGSGVDRTEFKLDGAASYTPYTAPLTIDTTGTHTVNFRSVDKAGNIETAQSVTVKVDVDKPTAAATLDPAAPNGKNDWYTSPVTAALTAQDAGSGVGSLKYDLDGDAGVGYTTPVTMADGKHTLVVHPTDLAGNAGDAVTRQVNVDATAPVTRAAMAGPTGDNGWRTGPASVTLKADDGSGSGADSTQYKVDGGDWKPFTGAFTVTGDGTHTISYRSTDKAGNVESVKSSTLKIDGTAPAVLVSGLTDKTVYGDSVTVSVGVGVTDATSGVGASSATLDGKPVTTTTPTPLPLRQLALGEHVFAVTARDSAGNTTAVRLVFYVTTSYKDMGALIDQSVAKGDLDRVGATKLHVQIDNAAAVQARGKAKPAIVELDVLRTMIAGRADVTLTSADQTLLNRDAQYLIVALGGTASEAGLSAADYQMVAAQVAAVNKALGK
ncbi:ThuA domain-containing protein [Streptomyces sp. NBC_00842]|uniref:ThuA domain-containing protein n=1 Tax=Streptomyces sp. NBC_00842 TaxID=2975848 RepID=UPI00386BFD9B|nr:ThuA domain-containing protein [Streptomyces sp. NBC_00842]